MDIVIDSRALGRALNLTAAAANGKTTPILGNVLLRVRNGALTATGTNLENTTSVVCEVQGRDGSACVNARKLAELAKCVPPGMVRLARGEDDKQLEITFGRSRFAFLCANADDFPATQQPTDDGARLKRADLLDLLKNTLYCASRDPTRAAICCVRLQTVAGALLAVATDGHRLSIVRRNCGTAIAGTAIAAASIDRSGATEMMRALEDSATDEVALLITDKAATLVAGDVTISSRLVDLRYPAWAEVVPAAWPNTASLARADLVQALAQVSCVAGRDNRVGITGEDGVLTLSGANAIIGDCSVTVSATTATRMAFAVNGAYLADAIRHVAGSEITIAHGGPLSPIGVWGADRNAELAVIMPIR